MIPGSVRRTALLVGLLVAATGAGCFVAGEEESDGSRGRVTGVADVLKSTLVLDAGCIATKVGPRHLLTAARCVAGKPEIAAGQKITFKQAHLVTGDRPTSDEDDAGAAPESEDDAGADEPTEEPTEDAGDAGTRAEPRPRTRGDAGTRTDAGAPRATNRSTREATIEKVEINASYSAKCSEEGSCAFGEIDASDAKDVAVIVLDAELQAIPTIPIDLDAVGQSDRVLVVGSGCDTFDEVASEGVKTFKTIAVPPRVVNHAGSPYKDQPQLVTRLGGAYVVTPGIGWRDGEPRICSTDIGAPLFRADQAAVTGVTSNFTTFADDGALVTIHHTRVDSTSRVGTWLKSLGVQTTRSCSTTEDGCAQLGYDGGVPTASSAADDTTAPAEGDAGTLPDEEDAGAPSSDLPTQGEQGSFGGTEGDYTEGDYTEGEYTEGDEGAVTEGEGEEGTIAPKKKKKAQASGCSAAPGSTSSRGDALFVGVGLAIAGVIARRRRAAR